MSVLLAIGAVATASLLLLNSNASENASGISPSQTAAPPPTALPAENAAKSNGQPVEQPLNNADRAYCQNRGILRRLAASESYRGALCSMNGSLVVVTMSRTVGGNLVLPATLVQGNYSARGLDGTEYIYSATTVSVVTAAKTFEEKTTEWDAPGSNSLANPGDLGLSTPITFPSCDDGSVAIILGTAWHPATNATEVEALLNANPGSSYLRTDLSCRSFWGPSSANSDGEYVYAVYSKAASPEAACKQTAGTKNYVRLLSNQLEPGRNIVTC